MGVFDLRDSGPRGVTSHRERSASGHRGVYGGGGGGGGGGKRFGVALVPPFQHYLMNLTQL